MTPEERAQKFQEEYSQLCKKYGISWIVDLQGEKIQGELTGVSYAVKGGLVLVADSKWSIAGPLDEIEVD